MDPPAVIGSLPNEILMSIFSTLPTRSLLLLVQVNRRFYAVALRVLHLRLLKAAPLPKHRLIFEFYYPSAKITTPYLVCNYLYTDTLSDSATEEEESGLKGLKSLYSHFLPINDTAPRRRLRSWAPPMVHEAVANNNAAASSASDHARLREAECPVRDIQLDENVLFSQLCTVTNLVKVGPRPGLFLSHVNVSESVIRVWRNWLAAQAHENDSGGAYGPEVRDERKQKQQTQRQQQEAVHEPILWADARQHVGLRVRVVKKQDGPQSRAPPLLSRVDDEPAVSYRLEVEEVLVRTNQLLMKLEESEVQEVDLSGKAIVIAIV